MRHRGGSCTRDEVDHCFNRWLYSLLAWNVRWTSARKSTSFGVRVRALLALPRQSHGFERRRARVGFDQDFHGVYRMCPFIILEGPSRLGFRGAIRPTDVRSSSGPNGVPYCTGIGAFAYLLTRLWARGGYCCVAIQIGHVSLTGHRASRRMWTT